MILGCVLAGGQSTRFGSDKALAGLEGQTLLERAIAALSGWCDTVIVAGREQAPMPTVADWPRAGMGPLGGIAAALHFAQAEGYAEVLTCGVDSVDLPHDLPVLLAPAPACLEGQPVVGLWPASASVTLDAILLGEGRHSLRRFADAIGARLVRIASEPANINTREDLARLRAQVALRGRSGEKRHGL